MRASQRVNSYDRDAPTPAIGSRWIWELGKPWAQETLTVTEVEWNGEEWWVCTISDGPPRGSGILGKPYWNDLSRFWEAVSPPP